MGLSMNKQINFEDNIFILNVRIRMLMDLLHLDVDPGFYAEKTLDDIAFIDMILNSLLKYLTENRMFHDREDELDKLIDLEYRFDQLLEGTGKCFPLIREQLLQYKTSSTERRKNIDDTRLPVDQSANEPVVSSLELNELLREL